MNPFKIAQETFVRHIQQNRYPGRGLVVGRSSVDDAWLIVYWIMGRSAHSQNRRFVAEGPCCARCPSTPAWSATPA